MAALLSNVPESLAGDVLPHKTWTRAEVEVLESTGLFDGTHFELVDGELIDKMGKEHKHVKGTRETVIALGAIFGPEYIIHEAPIDVAPEDNPRNEPEPDVVVLRRSFRDLDGNPQPGDIGLAVEIADSSVRQDLTTKARLYARAGIAEYWVLDVKNRRLHVLRDPSAGAYRTELELGEEASVSPLGKPSHLIPVAGLLP